jgi:hypothetical protein
MAKKPDTQPKTVKPAYPSTKPLLRAWAATLWPEPEIVLLAPVIAQSLWPKNGSGKDRATLSYSYYEAIVRPSTEALVYVLRARLGYNATGRSTDVVRVADTNWLMDRGLHARAKALVVAGSAIDRAEATDMMLSCSRYCPTDGDRSGEVDYKTASILVGCL